MPPPPGPPPPPFETRISTAVSAGAAPPVVLLARSTATPTAAAASISSTHGTAYTTRTVLPLMSATKLVTAVAAAALIQDAQLTLDADIAPLLPRLAAQPILLGFAADNTPRLQRRVEPITLRCLLTHTLGQPYAALDPALTGRFLRARRRLLILPDGTRSVDDAFDYPLTAQPGRAWCYGSGPDWAGLLIERVTGETLDAVVRRRVLEPLGLTGGMTFFPAQRPELLARRGRLFVRRGDRVAVDDEDVVDDVRAVRHCMGGAGLWADAETLVRVLAALADARDERVLRRDTAARLLFAPQLGSAASRAALHGALRDDAPASKSWVVGWCPGPAEAYDWSLAGLLTPGGNGHRGRGFLQWGGMLNTSWFIDREAGVTGLFMTGFTPAADPQVAELIKAFELGVYEQLAASGRSSL